MMAAHHCETRQLMGLGIACVVDIEHMPSTRQQCISDQLPMTPPRHRFSAHDGGSRALRLSDQLLQRFIKCWRLHEIGIGAKTFALPAQID